MEAIHHLHHLNPWPILVSALFQWLLGAIWYSPALFAKPWMKALDINPDGKKKGLLFAMASSFVASLLLSFVLWHIVVWAQATTWPTGIFVGALCWLGFIVAPLFPQGLYERRPLSLFTINTGYWLTGMAITGGLLATWR